MARGDLLLFQTSGSLPDRAIEFSTKGPFIHVAIDTGDGLVEAQQGGIAYVAKAQVNRSHPVYIVPVTSTEADGIEKGIEWVRKQVGLKYGWGDIFSNIFKYMHLPFFIGEVGHWDCSDLATRYLINADAAGQLGKLADDPGIVTPNDLSRAYGVTDLKGTIHKERTRGLY